MPLPLTLGILAHVDAGKTSLTERLLFDAGVVRTLGAVDAGTTQTDTMDLERQRGITIRSAVVAFTHHGHAYNLLDTPGHPDFIAEVQRALKVLDAVVLVVSAVEGVQPQTRRLSRAIERLGLPCIIFVNKIDRSGARDDDVIASLGSDLGRRVVSLSEVVAIGTCDAESTPRDLRDERIVSVLADHDDALLQAWIDRRVQPDAVRAVLDRHVGLAEVTPVVFGSAMTGAGLPQLFAELGRLVPQDSTDDEMCAQVFKIERTDRGERLAYARIWSDTLRVRDTVEIVSPDGREVDPEKITRIERFHNGAVDQVNDAGAGEIVRLQGLHSARIGDWLGSALEDRITSFDPPVFESRIDPVDEAQRFDLNRALDELADEDPLIDVRRDEHASATFVHLYGEVQEQVLTDTLHRRFGIESELGEPSVLYVERLAGVGRAAEIWGETDPPFYATVGFIVQPRRGDRSSWTFTPGKAKKGFFDAAEIGGRRTLREGLHGWPVIDWDVEVTDLIYLVASVPVDYRHLAELVMADAIRDAGTMVCEPAFTITVRFNAGKVGAIATSLVHHGGQVGGAFSSDEMSMVGGTIPARGLASFQRGLPGLTEGKVDVEVSFHDYQPVIGEPAVRSRTDLNPFDRREYLARHAGQY